jgi:phage head maturation protease
MGNEFLMIEAAAEGGKPKVIGLAYSGGKMSIPGWKYPIVVDLAGMQIPEQVPLLLNHENRTSSRVGMISAKIEQNTLTIEGEIIAKGEQADGIVEQAKAGADWQLSIGAEVLNSELVKDKRMVNGQENSGPFFHIQKSILREVSIVSVGPICRPA